MECARIAIPQLTSLATEPCSLELEGVLFRLCPRVSSEGARGGAPADPATEGPSDGGQWAAESPPDSSGWAEALRGLETAPVSAAVASIAGRVETVLQRAQIKVFPPTLIHFSFSV